MRIFFLLALMSLLPSVLYGRQKLSDIVKILNSKLTPKGQELELKVFRTGSDILENVDLEKQKERVKKISPFLKEEIKQQLRKLADNR